MGSQLPFDGHLLIACSPVKAFCPLLLMACPLFSVRSDWESVGLGAGEDFSIFGGGLVTQAGVSACVVVFAVPVGELDAGVQQARERGDVQQLVALA